MSSSDPRPGQNAASHEFGSWLKARRNELRLSRADFARKVSCSAVTVEKIETGQRRPSAQIAGLLAEALGVALPDRAAFVEFARAGQPPAPAQFSAAAARPVPGWPIPPTRLIGREALLASAQAYLDRPGLRLLTVTGPPGIGKTHLAQALGQMLTRSPRHPDGAAFVRLEQVQHPDWLIDAILRACRFPSKPGTPADALNQLISAIHTQRRLIVLDNFEHLQPAAPIIAELLSACPHLTLVVTSREPLRLRAEQQLPVPPLAADAPAAPAVQLFTERAHAANPDFQPGAFGVDRLQTLCARLGGVPLAIQLVAARAGQPGFDDLVRRPILESASDGYADLPERQRTLRACIAWSFGLLDSDQRQALCWLAAMPGGVRAEMAPLWPGAQHWPALRDKNLLIEREGRWMMLEPIRAFAESELAAGSDFSAAHRHAADALAGLAAQAPDREDLANAGGWLDRMDQERVNLRHALGWLSREHPGQAQQFATSISRLWHARGGFGEGQHMMEAALALSGPPAIRIPALGAAARLAARTRDMGRMRARAAEQLALATVERAELPQAEANFLLGQAARIAGDYPNARAALDRALGLFLTLEDTPGVADCFYELSRVANNCGDHARARSNAERALAAFDDIADRAGASRSLAILADACLYAGDYAQAEQMLNRAAALSAELGDSSGEAAARYMLGIAAQERGELARARQCLNQAQHIANAADDPATAAWVEHLIGSWHLACGEISRAVECYRHARAFYADGRHAQPLSIVDLCLAEAAITSGDLEQCRAWLARTADTAQDNPETIGRVARLRALVAAADGNGAQALDGLEMARLKLSHPPVVPELLRLLPQLARLRLECGDPAGARSLLARALPLLTRSQAWLFGPVLLEAAAQCAANQQDASTADALDRAAQSWRKQLGVPTQHTSLRQSRSKFRAPLTPEQALQLAQEVVKTEGKVKRTED